VIAEVLTEGEVLRGVGRCEGPRRKAGETQRTPGSAAGCKACSPRVEEAGEAVRNREVGTSPKHGRLGPSRRETGLRIRGASREWMRAVPDRETVREVERFRFVGSSGPVDGGAETPGAARVASG